MKIEARYEYVLINNQLHPSDGIDVFTFEGPVVYEVIRVMNGQPLFLADTENSK